MTEDQPITFWNRASKKEEIEQVYGDRGVRWLYGTPLGQFFANFLLTGRWPSLFYGWYQSSRMSRNKIPGFIRNFSIPMEEYERIPYFSFNDFFIRKFRKGAREFVTDRRRMPAFAEARYLAFERIEEDQLFPVKGKFLSAEALLGKPEHLSAFAGGPMLIARLCPTDYHRFHYPDWGKTLETYRLHGRFHSVNPVALRHRGRIFATNERHVTILETDNFGKLAYIEVGALLVGRIVQTFPESQRFLRGTEKGYFLFGASTVIVMGEKGRWIPDADLLEQTARQRETLVRLGEQLGRTL